MLSRAIDWLTGECRPRSAMKFPGQSLTSEGLATWWGGGTTEAGETIDENRVMGIAAFFRGTMLIADSMGVLPLGLYRRIDGGKGAVDDHPAVRLLRGRPNDELGQFDFFSLLTSWIPPFGNGVAWIERDGDGTALALHPAHPSRVWPFRSTDKSLWYEINNEDGKQFRAPAKDILHAKRWMRSGCWGIGAVGRFRETLGMTVAAEMYGARYFGNSARPSIVITMNDNPLPEELRELRKHWAETFGGRNSSGVAVVGAEGAKITPFSFNNEDSQFLQTNEHLQGVQIGRILGVSPYKLFDLRKANYSNREQDAIEFVTEAILPYSVMWEQELDAKLLTDAEREAGLFFEFNLEGLLRGDLASRMEAYIKGLQNGVYDLDTVLAKENQNSLPNGLGKIRFVPMNQISIEEVGAKVRRLEQTQSSTADQEFLRDIIKAFIADGTIADVIANNTRFAELMDRVGIPRETQIADPWLPIIADNGRPVTGEPLKDSEGDIVGGAVEEPEPAPSPDDNTGGGDAGTEADTPPASPSPDENDLKSQISNIRMAIAEAHKPLLQDTVERMTKVVGTAHARAQKRADFKADEFDQEYTPKVRSALIPPIEALAGAIRATLAGATEPQWSQFVAEQTAVNVAEMLTTEFLHPGSGLAFVDRFVVAAVARFDHE